MAKGKQTPRQKMINLMYLVFIAMLAMQIDQEIIRSYQDTNQSLTDSRKSSEEKNSIFEITLKQKADNSPETFGLVSQQYQGMKSKADELVDFIELIKGQLKTEAGFDADKNVEDIQKSADQSQKFNEELAGLTSNLNNLNRVYGGMLSAMKA